MKLISLLILVTCFATPFTLVAEERRVVSKIITDAVRRKNVNIDVLVTDNTGKPVLDLATPDFELLLDGKPVTITTCASAVPSAASQSTPQPTGTKTLTLAIFIDERNLSPTDRQDFFRQLALLANDQLGAEDRVLVTILEPGQRLRHAWLSEPQSIGLTLDGLGEADPEDIARAENAAKEYAESIGLTQGGAEKYSDSFMSPVFATDLAWRLEDQHFGERALFSTLARTIDSLAIAPGHKLLFIIGHGVAGKFGRDLVEISPAEGSIQDLIRRANSGRVSLYTISATAMPPAKNHETSVMALARATGGKSLTKSPTLEDELITIVQNHATCYTLTFPTDHAGDGKYHKFSIRLARPNCSLRYREGYWDKKTEERLADLAHAVIYVGQRDNPERISAHPGTAVKQKETYLLPITITIPTDKLSFVPSEEAYHASLVAGILILNPQFRIPEEFSTIFFKIDIPKLEFPTKSQQTTTLDLSLKVFPGPQRIAIVVSDEIAHVDSSTLVCVSVGEK